VESFHATGLRNLTATRELLAILELFAAERIPALPYKGPIIAAAEYGNLAQRPFCDLDILVRQDDVPRAKALLVERGYLPEHQLSPVHERAWLRARHDINLRRPDLDITVELHWEIVPRRFAVRFDNHRLWAETETLLIGGRVVRTLSPENLLLVLSVHGTKHRWSRLMWIADVAAVVTNHGDLDWAAVFREARRMGVERMLTVGLRLASDVAGCELPEHVRSRTENRATVRLAGELRERLHGLQAAAADTPLARSIFHVKMRERFRDKVRFAFYTVFVPSQADRLLVELPSVLTIFYYVLRLFRLARKYFRRTPAARVAQTP
jgi:hypothetical protein